MAQEVVKEAGCPVCDGTGWRLVAEDGVELVRRCDCAEETRRRRLLEGSGIPARYRHCTLDSFEVWNADDPTLARALRTVRELVDCYPEVDKGLLLMGGVGVGKTHLAVAALQELVGTKGVAGRFVDFTSLVLEIQMTFGTGEDTRGTIRPLISAELLVLDELGARKPTSWAMDLLYYLVNSRYVADRLTIFTTNYSDFPRGPSGTPVVESGTPAVAESLRDRISARIRSRLYEMCRRVELRGADYRQYRLASAGERKSP